MTFGRVGSSGNLRQGRERHGQSPRGQKKFVVDSLFT